MPGYSCVPAVNARCGSARTVTGASSTAVRGVPVLPGVSRYARPAPVTSKRGAPARATANPPSPSFSLYFSAIRKLS